jgi:hypothetical protein
VLKNLIVGLLGLLYQFAISSSCQPILLAYVTSCPGRLAAIGFGGPLSNRNSSGAAGGRFEARICKAPHGAHLFKRYVKTSAISSSDIPASRFSNTH